MFVVSFKSFVAATILALSAAVSAPSAASAATCDATAVQVYQPYVAPGNASDLVSANECVIGGNKNDKAEFFLNPLKAGALFSTVLVNPSQWTLLGKSDDGGASVASDNDNVTGDFYLNSSPVKINTFAVTLKSGNENFRAFLFTNLNAATKFWGIFDTGKAGLVSSPGKNGTPGNAQDLSHLSAAIYGIATVPLPAAGWLIVSALFGLGFLSQRRKAHLA